MWGAAQRQRASRRLARPLLRPPAPRLGAAPRQRPVRALATQLGAFWRAWLPVGAHRGPARRAAGQSSLRPSLSVRSLRVNESAAGAVSSRERKGCRRGKGRRASLQDAAPAQRSAALRQLPPQHPPFICRLAHSSPPFQPAPCLLCAYRVTAGAGTLWVSLTCMNASAGGRGTGPDRDRGQGAGGQWRGGELRELGTGAVAGRHTGCASMYEMGGRWMDGGGRQLARVGSKRRHVHAPRGDASWKQGGQGGWQFTGP